MHPCERGQGALHAQVASAPDTLKATQCRHSPSALRRLQPAVEAHSPDAVSQIRQHLVPAVAHFSVRPSVMMTHGQRPE